MKPSHQFELPKAGDVFNLASEVGEDPFRVERERWEAAQIEKEREAYAARMQLSLAQCPGFAACDAPSSEIGKGKVVVEPGKVQSALAWLKRRFQASENIELSEDGGGIVIEIAPRQRRAFNGGQRLKVKFGKVEQFKLPL